MATPKNEKEQKIYERVMKRTEGTDVVSKMSRAEIEAFRDDQTTRESWEDFEGLFNLLH